MVGASWRLPRGSLGQAFSRVGGDPRRARDASCLFVSPEQRRIKQLPVLSQLPLLLWAITIDSQYLLTVIITPLSCLPIFSG